MEWLSRPYVEFEIYWSAAAFGVQLTSSLCQPNYELDRWLDDGGSIPVTSEEGW